MGKFDLVVSSEKEVDIDKNEFYLNVEKTAPIQENIQEQLGKMYLSLANINVLLNKVVKSKIVKGTRAGIYKGWAKRTKGQVVAISKLKEEFAKNYAADLKAFSINAIDLRISELEKKIEAIVD